MYNYFVASCLLPQITNGQYLSGYRAGLTIANGSSVNFQCDTEYNKLPAQPVDCILGELYPRSPACRPTGDTNSTAYDKASSQYLGGRDIIIGGDLTALSEYGKGAKPCGPPAK